MRAVRSAVRGGGDGTSATSATATALANERDVLLASIEDLEREHAAGDIDDADFATLRAGYVARTARILRALEALAGAGPTGPGRSRTGHGRRLLRFRRAIGRRRARVALGLVGAVCALGLVAVTAAHLAGIRLPGEETSGSVRLASSTEVRQELAQASILGSSGSVASAVAVYGTVLREVPDQPEALTYRGWLVRLAGIADGSATAVASGDGELAKAVAVAPTYPDARALDGIALLQDKGRLAGAVGEFRSFLADRPPAGLLHLLGREIAAAFVSDHEAVPGPLRRYEPVPGASLTPGRKP